MKLRLPTSKSTTPITRASGDRILVKSSPMRRPPDTKPCVPTKKSPRDLPGERQHQFLQNHNSRRGKHMSESADDFVKAWEKAAQVARAYGDSVGELAPHPDEK